jgi:hypothetical protein
MYVISAHHTYVEQNTSFSLVSRLCEQIKNKGYTVYMDRWFSSPMLFDHLWASRTKAAGNVMTNSKVMSEQHSSKELEK